MKARTQSVQHLIQSQGVLPWLRDALPLVFADDALIAVGDLWWRCAGAWPGASPVSASSGKERPIIV